MDNRPTTALAHPFGGELRGHCCADQIGIKPLAPLFTGRVDAAVVVGAGDVDEDVETAKSAFRKINCGNQVAILRYVGTHEKRGIAEFFGGSFAIALIDIRQDNFRTRGNQRVANTCSDQRGGPRHKGCFAAEFHDLASFLCFGAQITGTLPDPSRALFPRSLMQCDIDRKPIYGCLIRLLQRESPLKTVFASDPCPSRPAPGLPGSVLSRPLPLTPQRGGLNR